MKVVVIDADPGMLGHLREAFPAEADLHLCDPARPMESGLELARAHPDARVFLGAAAAGLKEALPKPKRARLIGDKDAAREAVRAALAAESPDERKRRLEDEWYWSTNLTLRRQHGGRVAAIHGQRVWAVGDDVDAVIEAASKIEGAPPVGKMLVGVVPSDPPVELPPPSSVRGLGPLRPDILNGEA